MAMNAQLVLFGQDEMTPVVTGAAQAVNKLTEAVKGFGSASAAQRRDSAEFYSKLREMRRAGEEAGTGMDRVSEAATRAAQGGIAELTGASGQAVHTLVELAGGLTGLGGPVTVAIALAVTMAKAFMDIAASAKKSLEAVQDLSKGIERDFQKSVLVVQKLNAEMNVLRGTGTKEQALTAGSAVTMEDAIRKRAEGLEKAKKEFEESQSGIGAWVKKSFIGVMSAIPGLGGMPDTESSERRAKEVQIEATFAEEKLQIEKQLQLDKKAARLQGLKDFLQNMAEDNRAAEEAAEKRKQEMKDLRDNAAALLKDLPGGEKLAQAFNVEQFVDKATEEVGRLEQAIARGDDTTGKYAQTVTFLKDKMKEAIQTGIVPSQQELDKLAKVEEEAAKKAAEAAKKAEEALKELGAAAAKAASESASVLQKVQAETSGGVLALVEADRKAALERVNIERDTTLQKIAEQEKLSGNVKAANAARVDVERKALQDITAAEITAAEARRKAIESVTDTALALADKLGAGFAGLKQKLSLADFIQETTRSIEFIQKNTDALKEIGVTETELAATTARLTAQIRTATTEGWIPQQKALEAVTQSALGIVEKLGAGFGDIAKKLNLAQFITDANRMLETVQQDEKALRALGLTQEDVARLTQALTERLQKAVTDGYLPQAKAIDAVTESTQRATAAQEEWQASIAAGGMMTTGGFAPGSKPLNWKPGDPSTTTKMANYVLGIGPASPTITGGASIFGGSGGVNLQPWMDRLAAQTTQAVAGGVTGGMQSMVRTVNQQNAITINQAAGQDPMALAHTLMPALRRGFARGTL